MINWFEESVSKDDILKQLLAISSKRKIKEGTISDVTIDKVGIHIKVNDEEYLLRVKRIAVHSTQPRFGNVVDWKGPKISNFGHLAFVSNPAQFYHCRDGFQGQWLGNKTRRRILLALGTNDATTGKTRGKSVAYFINRIEEALHLEEKCLFNETTFKGILRIKVAPFWVEEPLRMSLFTALLRAGVEYNVETDNFDACIKKSVYLHNTVKAFEKFMQGFVSYSGDLQGSTSGWYQTFVSNKNIKLLVKPKKKTEKKVEEKSTEMVATNT